MKRVLLTSAVLAAAYACVTLCGRLAPTPNAGVGSGSMGDGALVGAIADRRTGAQVRGEGVVARLLPDDNDGSRHQRFIVRLGSGQTLLVAHNIDVAGRIDSLGVGDRVEFSGEYEWNPKGGVIHWTHHDPRGRHEAGWIRHGGKTYR